MIFSLLWQEVNSSQHYLSHAYNQLLLDEESRKFVTVNTHKGLYQYTHLPFGIAPAPAMFQRVMDKILQGLEGVACYTGFSPCTHLMQRDLHTHFSLLLLNTEQSVVEKQSVQTLVPPP